MDTAGKLQLQVQLMKKIWFDTVAAIAIISSFFVYFFSQGTDYYIGLFSISKHFVENELSEYECGLFEEFQDSLCSPGLEICEKIVFYEISGYFYVILSCLTLMELVYSSFHLLRLCALSSKCNCAKQQLFIYLPPFTALLNISLYLVIARAYDIFVESSGSPFYPGPGLYLNVISIVSMCLASGYYCCLSDSIQKAELEIIAISSIQRSIYETEKGE